jgi:hypothetical protein
VNEPTTAAAPEHPRLIADLAAWGRTAVRGDNPAMNAAHTLAAPPACITDRETERDLRRDQDRKDSPAAVAALLLVPATERERLLETDPLFAAPGVAQLLLGAATGAANSDPRNACALARLALAVTQRIDRRLFGEAVVAALAAQGCLRLAGALRHHGGLVADDGAAGAAALAAAASPLAALERATACRLAAAVRDDEGHTTDAVSSLLRNPRLHGAREEPRQLGEALSGCAGLLARPDAQAALSPLRQALALVDPAADSWAALRLHQALALAHAHLGQPAAAREILQGARELIAVAVDQPLDALRYGWSEAKILEHLGDHRRARRLLLLVAEGLARNGRPFEAAFALLDHAELLVRVARRPGELASLRALGARLIKLLPRRAFAVLTIALRLAGRKEVVFADLLDHVRDYLRAARRDPDHPYTPSGRPRASVVWDRLTVPERRQVCRLAGVGKRLAACAASDLDPHLREVVAWSYLEVTATDILWGLDRADS